MRLVIVESPYAGPTKRYVDYNLRYLAECLNDCLKRDESPYAAHGLLTMPGVLDDTKPHERQHGINAGLAWARAASAVVFYTDLGWSQGMLYARERHEREGRKIELRHLAGGWSGSNRELWVKVGGKLG